MMQQNREAGLLQGIGKAQQRERRRKPLALDVLGPMGLDFG